MPSPSTSLHERILADVRGRIVAGAWPPGYRIPNETELCRTYDCSRMTVNKALSMLARSGLIERRRKAGSFVAAPRTQSAVMEIQDVKIEVEHLGLAYGYTLLKRETRRANELDTAQLGVSAGTQVLALTCLHEAGDKPFCLERRLINLAAVQSARDANFAEEAPGRWLVTHVPWSEARHVIRAVGASAESARLLSIAPSTACLTIERRTWSAVGPITYVTFTYPGTVRELVATFHPSSS